MPSVGSRPELRRRVPISYQTAGWLLLLPLMISDKWAPSIRRYAVELFPMTWGLVYALRRKQWRGELARGNPLALGLSLPTYQRNRYCRL